MNEPLLAIIKNAKFGMDLDLGVGLSFSCYTSENSAFDTFLNVTDAVQVFVDSKASDASKLNGKACWVTKSNGIGRFVKIANI